jgi:hypothetical protein
VPELPNLIEEDTEMTEDIVAETHTDLESSKSPTEGAASKSLETVELELEGEEESTETQSHVQEEDLEEDVGESMEEDLVIDLTQEEEDLRTPDRGFSETVIPDSFDRAESVDSQGWPN